MNHPTISLTIEIPEPLYHSLTRYIEGRKWSLDEYLTFALADLLMRSIDEQDPPVAALYLGICLKLFSTEDLAA